MKKLLQTLFFFLLVTQISFAQWVQTSGANGSFIYCFTVKGTDIFAGYGSGVNSGGIIRSTDYGVNWTDVSAGLPSVQIMALTTSGNNLFTSEYDGGIYISTDDGANWNITALTVEYILGFSTIGTNLFAASKLNGVYLSTNNGTNWNLVNSGLTNTEIRAIYAKGSDLFVGTRGDGVFISTNNGSSWTAINSGLTMKYIYSLVSIGSNLFAGTWNAGVFRTTNNGTNWTAANTGLPSSPIYALTASGSNLFAGTYGSGIYLSTDNGNNWSEVNNGLTALSINSLAICGSYLYAGGDASGVWRRPLSEMITDVNEGENNLPTSFSLSQNYPNPFNPSTKISWQSPVGSQQTLKIYDVLGNEVATLINEYRPAGKYETEFSAKGGSASGGNAYSLPSGVYFYQLKAGNFISTKKMILMK
jgi:photosystem II stability/assembly factor-like uncharacterized protein